MNEIALHFAAQAEIQKLPEKQREIYEYVVNYEESLADRAATEEEFKVLLLSREPYEAAAQLFRMTGLEIVEIVNHCERQIQTNVSERMKRVGWFKLEQGTATHSFLLTL